MLKGKTKSGFEFNIKKETLDDMELIDLLVDVEENPLLISKVAYKLLGAEQKQSLYDHLRTKKGNVPIEKVTNVIVEIFNSNSDSKNV